MMLIIASGFVVLAGVRLRRLVPKHWETVRGEWIGPALRFSSHQYRFRTPDGVERFGQTRVKVLRAVYGGACVVAYDPTDPTHAHPAQLRRNGTLLIIIGVLAAGASAVLLGFTLG
ncbi:hypothetical protein [Leucobacter sp. BZR 635]